GVDVFFYQAEDGIRDRTVTGVQTCALPISEMLEQDRRALAGNVAALERRLAEIDDAVAALDADLAARGREDDQAGARLDALAERSEERRVGKESRSRRAREAFIDAASAVPP